MSWIVIILLPKGGGNFWGVGLLDPFWKVVEKIMVRQLGTIEFHPCLHGGLPKRGTGTATVETKLVQQLCVFLASSYGWGTVMHEIPISTSHPLTSLPYPRTQ
jgi:hypothetical protein